MRFEIMINIHIYYVACVGAVVAQRTVVPLVTGSNPVRRITTRIHVCIAVVKNVCLMYEKFNMGYYSVVNPQVLHTICTFGTVF